MNHRTNKITGRKALNGDGRSKKLNKRARKAANKASRRAAKKES